MRLNRKIKYLGMLGALLILFSAWLPHKFYVTLSELRYNTHSERFELSMRIFPDDLDRALLEQSGIQTQLVTEYEHEKADSLLTGYLLENFSLQVDGREIGFSFLGKEAESDALWCYLESEPVSDPGILNIRNELLTEYFPDQVNIVQVYWEKWNKGMLLNRDQNSGTLTLGK